MKTRSSDASNSISEWLGGIERKLLERNGRESERGGHGHGHGGGEGKQRRVRERIGGAQNKRAE